jgi:hypothetical protein
MSVFPRKCLSALFMVTALACTPPPTYEPQAGDDALSADDKSSSSGSKTEQTQQSHQAESKPQTTAGLTVTSISPTSTTVASNPGGLLSLTVKGTGFEGGAVVVFSGSDLATSLVDANTVSAQVPNGLLETAGQAKVTVRRGTTVSSPLVFTVRPIAGTTNPAPVPVPTQPACETTCRDAQLSRGQCADVGGLGQVVGSVFGVDLGSVLDDLVQCGDDGCVHPGCN